MENLRARQAMFLTMLLGGARSFSRQDLAAAHAGSRRQGMSDADFEALLKHFRDALREVGVAADYAADVVAQLETTRSAVLGR